jgi:hypothetical protein
VSGLQNLDAFMFPVTAAATHPHPQGQEQGQKPQLARQEFMARKVTVSSDLPLLVYSYNDLFF